MEIYKNIESLFERMANAAIRLFRNPLVFIGAVGITVFWFCVHDWHNINMTDIVRDVILSITFLSFFIIQKTFSHFSQALHLKLNELVAAHENARNLVVKSEEKSVAQIKELAKEHDRIIETEENKTDN